MCFQQLGVIPKHCDNDNLRAMINVNSICKTLAPSVCSTKRFLFHSLLVWHVHEPGSHWSINPHERNMQLTSYADTQPFPLFSNQSLESPRFSFLVCVCVCERERESTHRSVGHSVRCVCVCV